MPRNRLTSMGAIFLWTPYGWVAISIGEAGCKLAKATNRG
jgi:hypothetical protein